MSFLTTHNLSVGYRHRNGNTIILQDLNLSLERGELVALLGANGAGKSTLLRTLTAVQPPISGTVEIDGCDINRLTQKQRSRLIGIVTTDRIMAGALTVRELVALGRQPHTGFLGRLDATDKQAVEEALHDAGISHKAQCYVSQLSDGERQKAMVAKSLAQSTPIIILDEPTAFLDVAARFETMQLLHNLAHKHNKAVLLSSHDISQSLLLADRICTISTQRTVRQGNTEDMILSGALQTLFNSDALHFNPLTTDFEASLPHHATAQLVCNDEVLIRCISNALIRNGMALAPSAPTVIEASSATHIAVNGNVVHSIEQLIAHIKLITDAQNQ